MARPRWWLTAGLVWKKRALLRAIYTNQQETDRLNAQRLDFERDLAEVDAAIDAALDDGIDLLAEWAAPSTTGQENER